MKHTRAQHGFTLIEVIATMVIVSAIAAVMVPLIVNMSDAYVEASNRRTATEQAHSAMERITLIIRNAPETMPGTPDLTLANDDDMRFGDGTRLTVDNGTLMLTTSDEAASPLCNDVRDLTFTYLGDVGQPLDLGGGDALADVRRVNIDLSVDNARLTASAFMRLGRGGAE